MILITDIDGTLFNSRWRENFKPDWDQYHLHASEDEPYETMKKFVNDMSNAGWLTVAISTRPEKWRQLTMDQLLYHKFKIDQILLRPNENFNPSPVLKYQMASQFKDVFPVLALDDREDVIASYITLGFTAFHVRHP